jgi:hypothetical protein
MVRQHDPGDTREGLSPTATGAVGDSFEPTPLGVSAPRGRALPVGGTMA